MSKIQTFSGRNERHRIELVFLPLCRPQLDVVEDLWKRFNTDCINDVNDINNVYNNSVSNLTFKILH